MEQLQKVPAREAGLDTARCCVLARFREYYLLREKETEAQRDAGTCQGYCHRFMPLNSLSYASFCFLTIPLFMATRT